MEIGFGPLKLKASGRTVTAVILAGAIFGEIYWHDYKDDAFKSVVSSKLEAIAQATWVQTYVLSHPEKERAGVVNSLPDEVKSKITNIQKEKK